MRHQFLTKTNLSTANNKIFIKNILLIGQIFECGFEFESRYRQKSIFEAKTLLEKSKEVSCEGVNWEYLQDCIEKSEYTNYRYLEISRPSEIGHQKGWRVWLEFVNVIPYL